MDSLNERTFHLDNSGRYWFRKIPTSEVLPETVQAAERVFSFVVNDLELADIQPSIVWIVPVDWRIGAAEHLEAVKNHKHGTPLVRAVYPLKRDDFYGWTPPQSKCEIWIRADHDSAVERAVAHELRHLYQKKKYGDSYDHEDPEPDAHSYELEVLTRYHAAGSTVSTKGVSFQQKVAEVKAELEKLPADRQEQLRRELERDREQ